MYSFGGFDDGLVNGTWGYLFGGCSANRLCKDSGVFFYVMAPTGPLAMAGHICLRNGRLFLVQCMQAAWV